MKRNLRHNSTPARDRRGVVVGLLLLVLVFLTGFAAVAVNVSRLQHLQTQMRTACRASALAGAAELLDDGALAGQPSQADDVWTARQTARFFAERNLIDGRPLRLDLNEANEPQGDLVVGWIDPAGPVGRPLLRPTADEPHEVNTLRVTARASRNVADKVSLWFGGLVGITSFDVAAQAQASIDRRVIGFRPEPGVRVPVMPLVADVDAWYAEAQRPADPETNDLYVVNPLTGEVTPGADGIAEMTLIYGAPPISAGADMETTTESMPTNDDAAETATSGPTLIPCAPIALFNELDIPYVWPVRCREGLSVGDLAPYGGQLVLSGGKLSVELERSLLDELPYGLMDVVGQPRAWPLGVPSESSGVVDVLGFGAARIVAVRRDENLTGNAWLIVVQPTTLASSQAVASRDALPNPWIAKLELTQ